jgi:hypothetical protein
MDVSAQCGEQRDKPDDGVELVLAFGPRRETGLHSRQDVRAPVDAERCGPVEQPWNPFEPIALTSLAPHRFCASHRFDARVVCARVRLDDHELRSGTLDERAEAPVEGPEADRRVGSTARLLDNQPARERGLADLPAAERPEQGLGIVALADPADLLRDQSERSVEVFALRPARPGG